MAAAVDFIQDTDNDILIKNGDLAIGESDGEHIVDIVSAYPAEWKEFPLCGVGIQSYLNSAGQQLTIKNSITKQLTADKFSAISVVFTDDGNFTVDAVRS